MVMNTAITQDRELPTFQRDEDQNCVMALGLVHFEAVKYFLCLLEWIALAFFLHMNTYFTTRHPLDLNDRGDDLFFILFR